MTRVVIFGATGFVGAKTLALLLRNNSIDSVQVIARRTVGFTHPKLSESIVSLDQLEQVSEDIYGDVIVLALGASMQSKGDYRTVDLDYGIHAAQLAKRSQIKTCIAVSSAMAHPRSLSRYLRIKGKFEQQLMQLQFEHLCLLRPGPLLGREKIRWQEELLLPIFKLMSWISGGVNSPLSGVHVDRIAEKIVALSLGKGAGVEVLSSHDINKS